MDVKIYVARHGQDIDNANGILNGHRDEPLTAMGRQQAKDVARNMLEAGFRFSPSSSSTTPSSSLSFTTLSAIYSSPLRRARETAEIFAGVLSDCDRDNASDEGRQTPPTDGTATEVEILDDLIERDFGVMTGQPTSSILERCDADRIHVLATDAINYFLDPPNAETFPDLIDRAHQLLFNIQTITKGSSSTSSPSSILLVTHGDFGKMLYAAYYNLHWEEVLRQFHFGNSEVLLLAKDSPPDKARVFETLQFNP
jgi:broad specificity phosphatase PhoE